MCLLVQYNVGSSSIGLINTIIICHLRASAFGEICSTRSCSLSVVCVYICKQECWLACHIEMDNESHQHCVGYRLGTIQGTHKCVN